MASSFYWNCVLCDEEYFDKAHWNRHLLESVHQIRAREAASKTWDGEEEKDRVLVVISKLTPVKSLASRLLRTISFDIFTTIVMDFVWWPERPLIGLIQFENS